MNETLKKWRIERRLKGICRDCPRPVYKPGASLCDVCFERAREATLRFRVNNPEKMKEYVRRQRLKRKSIHDGVPCKCGSTENLTYGEDVLCQKCRWSENGKKGGSIGSRKRWAKYYEAHPKVEVVKKERLPKPPKPPKEPKLPKPPKVITPKIEKPPKPPKPPKLPKPPKKIIHGKNCRKCALCKFRKWKLKQEKRQEMIKKTEIKFMKNEINIDQYLDRMQYARTEWS